MLRDIRLVLVPAAEHRRHAAGPIRRPPFGLSLPRRFRSVGIRRRRHGRATIHRPRRDQRGRWQWQRSGARSYSRHRERKRTSNPSVVDRHVAARYDALRHTDGFEATGNRTDRCCSQHCCQIHWKRASYSLPHPQRAEVHDRLRTSTWTRRYWVRNHVPPTPASRRPDHQLTRVYLSDAVSGVGEFRQACISRIWICHSQTTPVADPSQGVPVDSSENTRGLIRNADEVKISGILHAP